MKTMRDETESIRWVSTNNLHVTLKFLGDVEDREIYAICRAVNNAVQNASCFSLACRGVGAFPSIHQPRTIWVGIDDLDQELTTLFSRLESELSALGFPREPRRFKPHLTLGRVTHGRKNLGNLPAVIESMC
jgi:2'-5' RNA ligase